MHSIPNGEQVSKYVIYGEMSNTSSLQSDSRDDTITNGTVKSKQDILGNGLTGIGS